ncbi:unnamed protein product [Linum trigynum]|uniref:Uncharacterized protein n=1 Tax=Linum trigynum TaxID=586398 RepID=A0AAV2GFX0_9ROSI
MSSNQNYDKQEQTDKEVKIISETLQQAVTENQAIAVTENQARNHSGLWMMHFPAYSFALVFLLYFCEDKNYQEC